MLRIAARVRPGYPSRRWKAQQAFRIGVSAADAEWLMMWDDDEDWSSVVAACKLRKCPRPGETTDSQPFG